MAVREVRIDYKFTGDTVPCVNVREGVNVLVVGFGTKPAELVVAGEVINVNGKSGSVIEVGRTEINDDDSTNARTVLSSE